MKWSNTAYDNTELVLVSQRAPVGPPVAFQFTLDPTRAQAQDFLRCGGAARFAPNHRIAAVQANLPYRAHQRAMGMPAGSMTPSLERPAQSRTNAYNAWKNGKHSLTPTNEAGTRGLAWRTEVARGRVQGARPWSPPAPSGTPRPR